MMNVVATGGVGRHRRPIPAGAFMLVLTALCVGAGWGLSIRQPLVTGMGAATALVSLRIIYFLGRAKASRLLIAGAALGGAASGVSAVTTGATLSRGLSVALSGIAMLFAVCAGVCVVVAMRRHRAARSAPKEF